MLDSPTNKSHSKAMSLDPATVIRRMGVVASQVASQATATATTPLSVMVPGGAAEQDAALADFQHTISQAFAASPTWTGEGAVNGWISFTLWGRRAKS